MKNIACILLLLLFTGKQVAGFSMNIYFWQHQKEIVQKYCVNKNNPLMKCNGKCYLSLQLKKIESDYHKEKDKPAPFQPKDGDVFQLTTIEPFVFTFQTQTKTSHGQSLTLLYSTRFIRPFAPPPQLI